MPNKYIMLSLTFMKKQPEKYLSSNSTYLMCELHLVWYKRLIVIKLSVAYMIGDTWSSCFNCKATPLQQLHCRGCGYGRRFFLNFSHQTSFL